MINSYIVMHAGMEKNDGIMWPMLFTADTRYKKKKMGILAQTNTKPGPVAL
jgi:hypothetical protein